MATDITAKSCIVLFFYYLVPPHLPQQWRDKTIIRNPKAMKNSTYPQAR